MTYLTARQIIALEAEGRTIKIHPRKHTVEVDDKEFKVNYGALSKYNYYKKYNFLVKE